MIINRRKTYRICKEKERSEFVEDGEDDDHVNMNGLPSVTIRQTAEV